MIQLLQVISTSPELKQMISREQMVGVINEIGRNLGGGYDLKLTVPQGQDPASPLMGDPMQQFQQSLQQIGQAIQQLGQKQQQDQTSIKDLAGAVAQLAASITSRGQLPQLTGGNTAPGQIGPGYPVGVGTSPLSIQQPMQPTDDPVAAAAFGN